MYFRKSKLVSKALAAKKTVGLLMIATLLLPSISPFIDTASSEGESIWNDNIVIVDEGETSNSDSKSNTICERSQVRKVQTAQPNIERNADGTINIIDPLQMLQETNQADSIDACIVQNRRGLFAGDLWSQDGNPNSMIRLAPTGLGFDAAPGGEVLLVRSGAPLGFGYRLSVNYNLEAVGQLAAGSQQPTAELQWRLINYADGLRYADNSLIAFLSHAFSANGKYLVGHLTNGFLVKINLQTLEMQPLAYSSSAQKFLHLSVSSDGDYVLSYKVGSLQLHDTTTCTAPEHVKDAWPATGLDTSGCTNQNLYSQISTLHPQIGNGSIAKLRFGLNSASFTVDGGWRHADQNNEFVWRRFTFTPENYVSRAQGYLAMGDSFSSGEGDTEGGIWYEAGTDEQGNKDTFEGRNLCHLSKRSYPYLLAIELGYLANNTASPPGDGSFHSVACSGAKIHNVVGGLDDLFFGEGSEDTFSETDNQYSNSYSADLDRWQPGRIRQLDIFSDDAFGGYLKSELEPEVITLGIGGNDVGFADTIVSCLLSPVDDLVSRTCAPAIAGSAEAADTAIAIAQLKPKLVDTYRQVKQNSPESRIYVHGYPVFVKGYGGNCAANVQLNSQETALVEEGVRYMNAVVQSAAQEAGVFYVDVTNILQGKNLCSGAAAEDIVVNGITKGNDIASLNIIGGSAICFIGSGCGGKESFHPTPEAHKLYTRAINDQTGGLTALMPGPMPAEYPAPNTAFFGQFATDIVDILNQRGYTDVVVPEPRTLLAASTGALTVSEDGLMPNSTVQMVLTSDPIDIGEFNVSADGSVDASIVIPDGVPAGVHRVNIYGTDRFGSEVHYYESIYLSTTPGDFDDDGSVDDVDTCPTIPNADIDQDQDGTDDACDGHIALTPDSEEPELPPACRKLEEFKLKFQEQSHAPTKLQKIRKKILKTRCTIQILKLEEDYNKNKVHKLRHKIHHLKLKRYLYRQWN